MRSTQRIDPVCFSNRTPRMPSVLLREGLFDGGCRRSLVGQDQEAPVQEAQAHRPWPRRRPGRRTAGGAARIRRRRYRSSRAQRGRTSPGRRRHRRRRPRPRCGNGRRPRRWPPRRLRLRLQRRRRRRRGGEGGEIALNKTACA